MKNYELLHMIGEVNEDYVQAANGKMVRPRFRWRALALCAACAALVMCAYPAYLASNPQLHDYAVVDGGALATGREEASFFKAPAGDAAPAPKSGESAGGWSGSAPSYNDQSKEEAAPDSDGPHYGIQAAPVQEAALWYDALLRACRLEENPEWYGGAWAAEDRLLAVAIVDGFRTPELEAELKEAAGAGAVLRFFTVKYSMAFLNGLMEPAARALEDAQLRADVRVDVMANCLEVDLYSGSGAVSDDVLAALAHLDPDGDAIRVRVYSGQAQASEE